MKAKKELNEELSRRRFIKNAAAGAGAAALAGIASTQLEAVQANQISKWDYQAEVVILGTGGAGLAAAITAHDLGVDVLVLEKASEAQSGGNTRVSGQGAWCPANFNDMITYQKALNDGYPVPEDVIQAFHTYSTKNAEWIQKIGGKVKLGPTKGEFSEFPGAASTIVCWPGEGQGEARLWNVFKEAAVQRKIKIVYETPGVDLIQDPKTKEIQGVVAERQSKKIYVKAKKAVILCTGGFENNQDMIRDYLLMPCGYPMGSPYNTGDGVRMAMAVGADLWHMDNQAGSGLGFRAPGNGWAFGGVSPRGNGYIRVAKDGTRFIDETIATKHGKIPYHGIYIHYPTPLPVHLVFDEPGIKGGPICRSGFMGWNTIIEHYKWSDDNSAEIAKGWILKADTIRELAGKMGKDPDALEKTVAAWNQSCAAGKDADFARPPDRMAAIQTPPYYAVELVPTFFNTQGGPRRNKNGQVLDTNRKPIPRLYSAGELGSIFSYHYQGSGNVGECIIFGRISAEHAVAEKPWS